MKEFQLLILILRLVLSPALIACATLVGRRWGPAVSGWFTGFPFVSAPVSIVLALNNGPSFVVEAAIGTIGGQCCVCLFALVYFFAAGRLKWYFCTLISLAAFVLSAYLWKSLSPGLLLSVVCLLAIVFLCLWVTRRQQYSARAVAGPKWDLPVRMLVACAVVYALTGVSSVVGAKWSGILSAFPVMGLILATFTQAQQGSQAARKLLRGSIIGSFGIAAFYLVIGLLMPVVQSLFVYLVAAVGVVLVNWATLAMIQHRPDTSAAPNPS